MDVAVEAFLFATAWFGHAFLMTVFLNWWFALPMPRWVHKRVRALVALLVFGFPLALAWVSWGRLAALGRSPRDDWADRLIFAWLVICWLTTFVYLPVITVVRALRRDPGQVAGCTSRVEDIAARLGEKPVGEGKHWRLAGLPGNQCFQVEFREVTLRLPQVPPAWDGVTILHLTDLHFCGTPGRPFFRQVFDLCLEAGVPDLLAITGDVVDSFQHHRWVVPLLGRLRWGTAAFAVLGNHDKYHDPALVRRRLRRIGVRVLGNGWEQIALRGEPLVVVGHEGPWFRPGPDLSECPRGPFRLCLSHTPDNIGWARRQGIDLMLAGHVHGGQVRVPVLGPLFMPSRFSRRYDCGAFYEPPTLMYVGRGLAGREPLRYNCRPEVTRIVLRSS